MKAEKDLTSVYIALLALIVIVVIFFLAYLSKMSKLPKAPDVSSNNSQMMMDGQQMATTTNHSVTQQNSTQPQTHTMTMESSGSIVAGSHVKFKIDHFKKLDLQPLEFDVFDESGKAYAPAELKVVNEMNMHFIVVSANLREYQHLHPTYENGKWKVLANLPSVGTYYAYVDIAPVKGSAVVLRSNLVVQKDTSGAINFPGLTPNLFALVKNFKAELSLSQTVALQQSVLSYHVTQGGKASLLQPYLANLGHVVIFRQGSVDSYMHVHPLSSSDAKNGLAEFMTTFIKGGRYTAFAEFKLGSKVYTFPITFDING